MRSWTVFLDNALLSLPLVWRVVIIAAVMAAMAVIARRKRFLTPGGIAASVILGFAVMYIGGVSAIVMLLFFFLSSSVISKMARQNDYIRKKSSERDIMQVIANGLPAALCLILFRLSPYPEAFLVAFASALAEAEADTLSGEVGRLSHQDPVSIITLTRVPKGLSGGVTVLGFVAGMVSSLVMALLFMGTFGCSFLSVLTITASGFLGSVFDSFLGATVQVQYRRKDGTLTEKSYENGEENERARGIKWIDNDMVNLLSGLFSVAIASSLSLLL